MRSILFLAGIAATASSVDAGVVFSNIEVSGSLVGGPYPLAEVSIGQGDVDIAFPFSAASVGDAAAPARAGNIVITFNVDSDTAIDRDFFTTYGTLQGSGLIIFNEVVQDRTPGAEGVIATANLSVGSGDQLPANQDIMFSRPTFSFRVTRTLFLAASDTPGTDIEQRMVPSQGAIALMALGSVVVAARRRRVGLRTNTSN